MGGPQGKIRYAEHHHGFQKSVIQFLAGPVIGKPVVAEGGLAEQIAPDLRLAPKMVDPECGDAKAEVHDLHA